MPAAMDDIVSQVCRLLAERAGVAPESFGVASIAHAVRQRIAASGGRAPEDYVSRLVHNPTEFQELLEDLVVPETWFFRDARTFRELAQQCAAARVINRRPTRALSIGCSTGEEVYSLAIALREAGCEPSQMYVLGTDVSRRAIAAAEVGTFPARSFRESDEKFAAFRERWCEPAGGSWRVRDELRGAVEFRWANLAEPGFLAGTAPFDLIFCRNVLIYFHADARRTAVGHIQRLLSPNGTVWSAPAEAQVFADAAFVSLGNACSFAFRREDASADAAKATGAVSRPQAKAQRLPKLSGLRSPNRASSVTKPRLSPVDSDVPSTPLAGDTPQGASEDALLQAATQAADQGDLAEADALCGQVLARNPARAGAHFLRGVVRQAAGQLAEAQRSLEHALYLDPRHYQALVHAMLLAEQRGDQQAATNYRRRAQQAIPREAP